MVGMKAKYILLWGVVLLLAAGCAAGDYSDRYPDTGYVSECDGMPHEFVVSVKQDADGSVYFLRGNDERLVPMETYAYNGPCRALGSFIVYGVHVHTEWIQELDRGPVLSAGAFADGIDIVLDSGITSVEDGYLTVHYAAWWGESAVHHDISLVSRGNGEFDLVHDAHGDARDDYAEGIVYFDINDYMPETGAGSVPVKVNWLNTSGGRTSAGFEFISRK